MEFRTASSAFLCVVLVSRARKYVVMTTVNYYYYYYYCNCFSIQIHHNTILLHLRYMF